MTFPLCPVTDLPVNVCACGAPHPREIPLTERERVMRDVLATGELVTVVRGMVPAHPVAWLDPQPTRPPVKGLPGGPTTLGEYIEALVEPTTHTEMRAVLQHNRDGSITRISEPHRTTTVSLLEQLASAVASTGSEAGSSAFGSRPAARLEAIDALQTIHTRTYRWLRDLWVADPHDTHPALDDALRQVRVLSGQKAVCSHCDRARGSQECPDPDHHGSAGHRDVWCCDWHHIESDARHWWASARVLTGWDTRAYQPNNTCPACGERGTLRVRLEPDTGFCTNCRAVWTHDNIQILARHIRAENHDDQADGIPWTDDPTNPRPAKEAQKRMTFPVRCHHCGHVHDAASVVVTERFSDCSVWRCPGCGAAIDDRPIASGGTAVPVKGHPLYRAKKHDHL